MNDRDIFVMNLSKGDTKVKDHIVRVGSNNSCCLWLLLKVWSVRIMNSFRQVVSFIEDHIPATLWCVCGWVEKLWKQWTIVQELRLLAAVYLCCCLFSFSSKTKVVLFFRSFTIVWSNFCFLQLFPRSTSLWLTIFIFLSSSPSSSSSASVFRVRVSSILSSGLSAYSFSSVRRVWRCVHGPKVSCASLSASVSTTRSFIFVCVSVVFPPSCAKSSACPSRRRV